MNIVRTAVSPVLRNRTTVRLLVRLLMRVHNFCYAAISTLAVEVENGIHPKHRIMDYHRFFTDNIRSQDMVLDIGCGNGYLTSSVAKKARSVVAVDLNQDNIETAKRRFHRDNVSYVCGDATRLEFAGEFDVVVLSNVLEHLDNRAAFLSTLSKRATRFLIRVPLINRDWLTYYKRELGVEYRLDLTHRIEYTQESFEKEVAEAGLVVEASSLQFSEIWAVVTAKSGRSQQPETK